MDHYRETGSPQKCAAFARNARLPKSTAAGRNGRRAARTSGHSPAKPSGFGPTVGCRVTFWALGKASGLNAAPLQRGPGREGASASQSRRNAGRASQPPKTFLNAGPRPVEVPNPTHRGFGPVSAHCERKRPRTVEAQDFRPCCAGGRHLYKTRQLYAVDHSARASMKSAASCVN